MVIARFDVQLVENLSSVQRVKFRLEEVRELLMEIMFTQLQIATGVFQREIAVFEIGVDLKQNQMLQIGLRLEELKRDTMKRTSINQYGEVVLSVTDFFFQIFDFLEGCS